MDRARSRSEQMYRLWIATYANWRPSRWNESPPCATAVEPVEDGLYSADQAALFLEGFNGSMLQHDQAVWAVAIPVTICYEGDAQPGMMVRGYVFDDEQATMSRCRGRDEETPADGPQAASTSSPATEALGGVPSADHVHGFDQSPQRSR